MAKATAKGIARKKTLLKQTRNLSPVPAGKLLIIGGSENKGEQKPKEDDKKRPANFIRLEVLKKFVDMVGKKDPLIEVITTASSEGAESFHDYERVFQKLGLKNLEHLHHKDRADVLKDGCEERVMKADAFFFTGGDQLKLTGIYGGSDFLTLLKQRYINEEIVIAGTSAGAMALSTPMIYAGSEDVQELGGEIHVTTGLEFLKDVCIDTHFAHRGRFIRMAQVVATNPTCIGIGIGEDTALVVSEGQKAEVIGTGSVMVIEGFKIEKLNTESFQDHKPITIKNLVVHILASGDTYTIPHINPPHK